MLGRGVAERLADDPAHELFAPEVVAAVREGDLVVLNLECCISERGVPASITAAIPEVDALLISPHWGPNMNPEPLPYVREAAAALLDGGATLVAGHSAHVFQGVAQRVLYDLGDFLDDYRVDPRLRNDLGLLFLVDLPGDRMEAVPLKLEFTRTRLADGDDAAWIRRRF